MGALHLLGLAFILGAVTPAPAPRADAYQLFDRARLYWDAVSYPQAVAYDITIAVSRNSVLSSAHYHAVYDTSTNTPSVDPTSDEEKAHPYTPHGINLAINLFGGSIPVSAPQNTFDFLGVPVLSPNYCFAICQAAPHTVSEGSADLVREIRAEYNDPQPRRSPNPQSSSLKTIASVEVTHRHYAVTLAGIQVIRGHADYDLHLRPLSDPGKYRLRELYVNEKTFATDRLVTAGNFTAGDLAGTRWTVDFQQVDGAPYIASEVAQSGFELARRTYDTASVTFSAITTRSSMERFSGVSSFLTNSQTAPPELQEPQ